MKIWLKEQSSQLHSYLRHPLKEAVEAADEAKEEAEEVRGGICIVDERCLGTATETTGTHNT